MKKFSAIVLFCVMSFNSCTPVATSVQMPLKSPSPSLTPANTVPPASTFTPMPTQTIKSISNPFFGTSRFSFLTFNSITVVSQTELLNDKWVVGNDGLVFRFNAESGTFSLIDTYVRANLYDVDFVSPDDGWVVGEDSLILHWNGEDWKVSKPVIIDPGGRDSYDLYSVAFIDTNDGWAAGCTGTEGGKYFLVYH